MRLVNGFITHVADKGVHVRMCHGLFGARNSLIGPKQGLPSSDEHLGLPAQAEPERVCEVDIRILRVHSLDSIAKQFRYSRKASKQAVSELPTPPDSVFMSM